MITVSDAASVADRERFATVFDAHYEEIRRYIGRRLDLDVAERVTAGVTVDLTHGLVRSRRSRPSF